MANVLIKCFSQAHQGVAEEREIIKSRANNELIYVSEINLFHMKRSRKRRALAALLRKIIILN